MVKFKASDYNEYNNTFNLFDYGYLHRLLDLLYKIHKFYDIEPVGATVFESETGNQLELNNTMYLSITKRVYYHQLYFKLLWSRRHLKQRHIIRQLSLF